MEKEQLQRRPGKGSNPQLSSANDGKPGEKYGTARGMNVTQTMKQLIRVLSPLVQTLFLGW